MNKEDFQEIIRTAQPNYMKAVHEMVLAQRTTLVKAMPGAASKIDILYLLSMGNMVHNGYFSDRQIQELNARYGANFSVDLSKWFSKATSFMNLLNDDRNPSMGKMKDYLTYLR